MAIGAAAGLSHLHKQGMIHRDIAARNIFLDGEFNAKVGDFGLAKQLEQAGDTYEASSKIALAVKVGFF